MAGQEQEVRQRFRWSILNRYFYCISDFLEMGVSWKTVWHVHL